MLSLEGLWCAINPLTFGMTLEFLAFLYDPRIFGVLISISSIIFSSSFYSFLIDDLDIFQTEIRVLGGLEKIVHSGSFYILQFQY